MVRQSDLFEIVLALSPNRFVFCFGQGWEQHGRENRNDCDYHEKFDQGKSGSGRSRMPVRNGLSFIFHGKK